MKSKFVLAGNLAFLSLGDVLQLLGTNGSTGIIRIKSRYADTPGLIYLVNGNPTNAKNGTLTGLEALQSLFGWIEGEFEFNQEPVTVEKVIQKNRMEIILDSLRMLDDQKIDKMGPASLIKGAADATGEELRIPFIKGPLVDYTCVVDEEGFSDGERITEEGKHGGWIWVVLEGTIEIVKQTPMGPASLVRLGDGAFVGSIASFLMEGTVRGATVIAVGNVQMGVLDSQRLATEYSCLSTEFRELVLSLDRRLRQVTSRGLDILLGRDLLEESLEGKELLIAQAANDRRILEIINGQASIVRTTDHGKVLLANLDRGDFFGQLPFLDVGHEPHYAAVYGADDLETRPLDADSLRGNYDRLSTTFRNIIEHTRNCISVTTSLACDSRKRKVQIRQ
jgi:CRP-like cAMP-binding protein